MWRFWTIHHYAQLFDLDTKRTNCEHTADILTSFLDSFPVCWFFPWTLKSSRCRSSANTFKKPTGWIQWLDMLQDLLSHGPLFACGIYSTIVLIVPCLHEGTKAFVSWMTCNVYSSSTKDIMVVYLNVGTAMMRMMVRICLVRRATHLGWDNLPWFVLLANNPPILLRLKTGGGPARPAEKNLNLIKDDMVMISGF